MSPEDFFGGASSALPSLRISPAVQAQRDAEARALQENEVAVAAGRPSRFPATAAVVEGSAPAPGPAIKPISAADFFGVEAPRAAASNKEFTESRTMAAFGVALDRLRNMGGEAAALADMVLSLPGFGLKVGAQLGGTAIAAGQHLVTGGTSGVPLSSPTGYTAFSTGREIGHDISEPFMNPLQKLLTMLKSEDVYNNALTTQGMQKFGEALDAAGLWTEQKTGGRVARDSIPMLAETLMYALPGLKGGPRPGTIPAPMQKVLREHATKLREEANADILAAEEARGQYQRENTPEMQVARQPVQQQINELLGIRTPAEQAKVNKQRREDARAALTGVGRQRQLTPDEQAALDVAEARGIREYSTPEEAAFYADERLRNAEMAAQAYKAATEQVASAQPAAAGKPRIKLKLAPELAGLEMTPEMEAALDKPPYQRSAAEKGLLQRWHDSWLKLPEETRTAIMAGGAAGLGMLLAPEGDEALGALGGLAIAGAVKQPGGMWHPEAMNRLARAITPDRDYHPENPVRQWSDRVVRNHLNKYLGTERDPLNNIEIPFGEGTKKWGEVVDKTIRHRAAWEYGQKEPGVSGYFEGAKNIPPDERIWRIAPASLEWEALSNQLSHVGDYLRQNVPPDKLGQYDLVRAVRETAANDARVAKEMEKAAQASTASLPVYKEYPDGFKWVELKEPEALTPEQAEMVRLLSPSELRQGARDLARANDLDARDVLRVALRGQDWQGGEVPIGRYIALGPDGKPVKNNYTGQLAYGATPTRAYLAGQLAQEGNVMGHCVGGYCEGVASGESRIFSLRDAKGKSHVTVEVEPPRLDPETFYNNASDTYRYNHPKPSITQQMRNDLAQAGGRDLQRTVMSEQQGRMRSWAAKLAETPEYKAALSEEPNSITQIKGKQNRAPAAQYQPYVQDFVRNAPEGGPAKWGEVGDLENTGLRDIRQARGQGGMDLGGEEFFGSRYVTREEFERFQKGSRDPRLKEGYVEPLPGSRNQRGQIDPRLLIGAGAIGLGGLLYSKWADDPVKEEALGLLAAGMLAGPRRTLQQASRRVADYVGQVSTELLNASPPLHRRLITHAQQELEQTHKYLNRLVPWMQESVNLGTKDRAALDEALFMKDTAALARLNAANPKMLQGWREVRATLDELGKRSQILGRFRDMMADYFPQRVKDYEGLKAALDQPLTSRLDTVLKEAEQQALRRKGFGLTDVERDAIINREIRNYYRPNTFRPGYAKPRTIQEVTQQLRDFYHTPQESLAITVGEVVKDLELAKLFGRDLVQKVDRGRTYIDLDASLGNILGREAAAGRLQDKATFDRVERILRARFGPGEKSPAKWIQNVQNLGYAALLADLPSAVVQLADPAISIPAHGWKATLVAAARKLSGNAKITAKDMSLMDHIAEDLAFGSTAIGSNKLRTRGAAAAGAVAGGVVGALLADDPTGAIPGAAAGAFLSYAGMVGTSAALNKVLRQGVFSPIDRFGKDIQLGAAHSKMTRWAEKDPARLKEEYGEWFGVDFPQFVADLRAGTISPAVRSALFHELSRTQPISKLEASLAYLENPNARIAYQLKRFMQKQADFVYREAQGLFEKGHKARALGNLTEYALVLGLSGATTAMIKDFLNGRPVNFQASDVAENVLKTFGLSNYVLDKMRSGKAGPIEAIGGGLLPPYAVFDRILTADPRAVQYIPVVGELYYNWELGGQEKAEIRKMLEAKKEGKELRLSPKAERYLEKQREERARKREREGR